MAIDSKRAAYIHIKSGEEGIKQLRELADEMKQTHLKAQQMLKASGQWSASLIENNKNVEKLVRTMRNSREAVIQTTEDAKRATSKLGKEFIDLEQAATDFKGIQFGEVRKNLGSVFSQLEGVSTAFQKIEELTGFRKNQDAIKETDLRLQHLKGAFDEVGISPKDFDQAAKEWDSLTDAIHKAREAGNAAAEEDALIKKTDLRAKFKGVEFDDENLRKASSAYKLMGSQLDLLKGKFGGLRPAAMAFEEAVMKVDQWVGKMGLAGQMAFAGISYGLTQTTRLMHQLQREVAFSNVGFQATLNYVNQIQRAVIASNGLVDMEEATRAFTSLHSHFREFTTSGSSVVNTSAMLHKSIGISTESFADLASQFKTLGVKDIEGGLKSAANVMAYFAKNTNLNTNEIQEMLVASRPLMEIYPDKLQKRLIPQLLGVTAAFKEIGLSGADAAKHLEQMADFSSPQGLLKAAFATQRGNISIDDILGGTKPGVAMAELGDSIHDLMGKFSGGDRKKFEFAAQRVSELLGVSVSEARRFGNMNDEMRAKFRKRIEQESEYAKQQTALSDALNEQMEGPINAFQSLWEQVKATLLITGAAAARVLAPAFHILGGAAKGLGMILRPVSFLIEKIGQGWTMLWKVLQFVWVPFEVVFTGIYDLFSGLIDIGVNTVGSLGDVADTLKWMEEGITDWRNTMTRAWSNVGAAIMDNIGYIIDSYVWLKANVSRAMDYMVSLVTDGIGFVVDKFGWMLGLIPNMFINAYNSLPAFVRKMLGGTGDKMAEVSPFAETAKSFHKAAEEMRATAEEDYQNNKNSATAEAFHDAANTIRKTADEEYKRKQGEKMVSNKDLYDMSKLGPETSYAKYRRTGNLDEWKAVEGTDKEVTTIPNVTKFMVAGYTPDKEQRAPEMLSTTKNLTDAARVPVASPEEAPYTRPVDPTPATVEPEYQRRIEPVEDVYDPTLYRPRNWMRFDLNNPMDSAIRLATQTINAQLDTSPVVDAISGVIPSLLPEPYTNVSRQNDREVNRIPMEREPQEERRRRQQEMDSRTERDGFMRRLEEASMSRLLPPPFQELVSFNAFD